MHTALYHDALLEHVPRPCRRALDIGCGTGAFAFELAAVAERVDAVDRSVPMIAAARARSTLRPNLRFVCCDFLEWRREEEGVYDFVAALASLHHLPSPAGILRMKELLRPGGVLAIVGLHRSQGLIDTLLSMAAFPLSRALRIVGRRTRSTDMPLRDPELTLREMRTLAREWLPGARLRRRLFWRYTLVYAAPMRTSRSVTP